MKKILIVLIFLLLPILSLATNKVDINSATITQLDELTGIGPVIAQRIIDARPFSSIDDLDKVKGIGPAILQKIKDQGLACVNCATESTSEVVATKSVELRAPPIYTDGIFINEILPNPKGSDETDEWMELFNSNSFEVNISGWQIQDTAGTITTYTIPQNTILSAGGFLVLKRLVSKIMLNNDNDGLNLLAPDGKITASVIFDSAPLGQSYNKTATGWQWSLNLTPGTENIVLSAGGTKILPKEQKSDTNSKVETAGLLNASENFNISQKGLNPWLLFFLVLAITIILAIVVLLIKYKFNVGT